MRNVVFLVLFILITAAQPSMAERTGGKIVFELAPDSCEILQTVDSILTLFDSNQIENFLPFLPDSLGINMGLTCGMACFTLEKRQMVDRIKCNLCYLAEKSAREEIRRGIASDRFCVGACKNGLCSGILVGGDCGYSLHFAKSRGDIYLIGIFDAHPDYYKPEK